MFGSNDISIAVIGSPACGKSYLLFDLIHAFHVLGYVPKELPLKYPYSSFGTFFYDAFNANTGGMRQTESYACRPENHYGVHLERRSGRSVWINFLNIPGETFNDENILKSFFKLKDKIDDNKKGVFWLANYQAPSGHEVKLIFPNKDFRLMAEQSIGFDASRRHVDYMNWTQINAMLEDGDYKEQGTRQEVTGSYLLEHMSELQTDSIMLTLKTNWSLLTLDTLDLTDYEANVFKHFYPLVFCQTATDLVICDKLTAAYNSGPLSDNIGNYLSNLKSHAPNIYLAFRETDLFLKGHESEFMMADAGTGDVARRNAVYSAFVQMLLPPLTGEAEGTWLDEDLIEHIKQSVGQGNRSAFGKLLNMSYLRNNKKLAIDEKKGLPPHVYFTATPIDNNFNIYDNDQSNVTRFILEDGVTAKSFVRETCNDMSRHMCFGALQLLIDILGQNKVLPSDIKNCGTEILNYCFNS